MNYEFEMLSVNCADAIILRFITNENHEYVVLIDAGNKSDGQKIIEQINKYTNQKYIDLAINTHPDSDHIGGFFNIVGKMEIKSFWIHDPSKHVNLNQVKDTITRAKLTRTLKYVTESLDNSENLLTMIDKYEIPREEPFAGLEHPILPIKIVGPTLNFYEDLLLKFRDINHLFDQEYYLSKNKETPIISESLSDTLDAQNDSSSENASSAIVLMKIDDKKFLFTADSTPDAQIRACKFSDLSNLYFLDVPHHGSKYNLTSALINHYRPTFAYISADGSRKYPSKAVINALKSVGTDVYCTAVNGNIHYSGTIGLRDGYSYPAIES